MSFIDWIRIDEVSLGTRITLAADDGNDVSGKVIALKLLEDEDKHRVTLDCGEAGVRAFDRKPSDQVVLVW